MKMNERLLEQIVAQVLDEIKGGADSEKEVHTGWTDQTEVPGEDLTSKEQRATPLIDHPADADALARMMERTTARIGVGRAGPREKTKTWLTLRADHALARDAVFSDVDENLIKKMGLLQVQSQCRDRNEHITRPDLGRKLGDGAREAIMASCKSGADVQLVVSDGLSSKAVEANLENILPVILEGIKMRGLSAGPVIFVKYGRVAVEDEIAKLLDAKVVCILVGERPGLGTAKSMSAYLCYKAYPGQPEARRTVVSNIYDGGISAVEAGAYVAELIEKILKARVSGVDLKQQ